MASKAADAAKQAVKVAKPAAHELYHQGPRGIWKTIHNALVVNPEISSGATIPTEHRAVPPGSRPEKYVTPVSKASDIADNAYHKRDFRRAYPKTSVITQNELAQLLLSAPASHAISGPGGAGPTEVTVAPADSELTDAIAKLSESKTNNPFIGLPPTPPARPNPLRLAEAAPHNPHAHFPMRLYN